MKKYFKTIGFILAYLTIYLFAQGLASGILIVFFAIKVGYEASRTNTLDGAFDMNVITKDMPTFIGQNISIILLISITITIIVFLLLCKLRKENLFKFCKMTEKISLKVSVIALIAGFFINIFISGILEITSIEKLFPEYEKLTDQLTSSNNLILLFLAIGILGPLFEEILFRGLILNDLRKILPLAPSVVIQALLFGVYHLNVVQGMYAFILGLVLGMAVTWTKSLWSAIIIHMAFNSLSLFLTKIPIKSSFEPSSIEVIIISLVVTIGSVMLMRKVSINTKTINSD